MRLPEVNPAQKQAKLISIQLLYRLFCLRPGESILLQFFLTEPESIPIPQQTLEHLPLLVAEQKNESRKGIVCHFILHEDSESVRGLSHVGIPRVDKYPCRQRIHQHAIFQSVLKIASIPACPVVAGSVMRKAPASMCILVFSQMMLLTGRVISIMPMDRSDFLSRSFQY